MEHIALVVDGTSQPIRAGDLAFPAARVARYRPLGGVLIAIVTALITAGAMGPAAPDADAPGNAAGAACAPGAEAVAPPQSGPVDGDVGVNDGTPLAALETWWLRPRPDRWVDPATGLTMQIDGTARDPVVDHRVRDH